MTVIVGINGQSWMVSSGDDGIERILRGLDGERWHSLVLALLPVGVDFRDCDLDAEVDEYIQCAGSADRLTIEVRKREAKGLVQYVVGSQLHEQDSPRPTEEVGWGDHAVHVYDQELFDATSALPIFLEYGATGELPDGFTTRELVL